MEIGGGGWGCGEGGAGLGWGQGRGSRDGGWGGSARDGGGGGWGRGVCMALLCGGSFPMPVSVCSVLRGQVWEMHVIPHLCRRISSSGKTHSSDSVEENSLGLSDGWKPDRKTGGGLCSN